MPTWVSAALAAAFALCVITRTADARPLDEIVESGTITVAVYREFPPFAEENGGDPRGIDIDIGRAIAREIGVDVRFLFFTADETVDDDLRNAVWKGHYLERVVADLMLHVPYDRQLDMRNEQAALYAPYYQHRIVVAQDPEAVGSGVPLIALRDQKIGVELDSLSDFFLMSAYGGVLRAGVIHYDSTNAAAAALRDGEVVAVIGPEGQIEAALGDRGEAMDVRPADLRAMGRSTWAVGIAVREDSRDLGYAVEDIFSDLVKSGEMEGIFADHGVTWRSPGLE